MMCRTEECPLWDGEGCSCLVFGFDPDDPPAIGIFDVTYADYLRPKVES